MTIITKPLSQQEKEKKNGFIEKPVDEVFIKEGKNTSNVESAAVIPPNPRTRSSTNMCLVVTCMLATCLGLTILGYHQLHRQYHPYKRGTCRLPCHMRRQQQQLQLCSRRRSNYLSQQPKEVLIGQPPQDGAALVFGDLGYGQGQNEQKDLISTEYELDNIEEDVEYFPDGKFEFKYEMDLEEEKFELIQMPDISSGLYVHDFTVNRTGIVEENRCFVMVMDRTEIAPPRNLFDLLRKTTDDGYEMDLDEIQHDMMIVLPTLTSDEVFKKYGWFIGKACQDKIVYKLEPVPEEIAAMQDLEDEVENEIETELEGSGLIRNKRSTMQSKVFEEISKSFIKYNIVNYDAADQ